MTAPARTLTRPERPPDWSDRHAGPLAGDLSAKAAYHEFLRNFPSWTLAAMALRNRVTRPFGLTGDGADGGDLMHTLPVVRDSPDCYEVGLRDRHLTFTLETAVTPGQVAVTTRIWFNHWAGRLYLTLVLIPHNLIVRHAIRRLS